METRQIDWLVGTSGWEHESFDSVLYQMGDADSEQKLRYYSRFFDTTEIRPTFWDETITVADAKSWIEAISENRRFMFSMKLHSSFTHGKCLNSQLSRNLRAIAQELSNADRLGAVLAQFPYSFTNTSANRHYLTKLVDLLRGFPVHVEFRHDSWDPSTVVRLLGDIQAGSVSSDFPRTGHLIPCLTKQVGEVVYVRLHGRNEKGWLLNEVDLRYEYLYNAKELREIVRRIHTLSSNARRAILICNNLPGGRAIANSLQLSSMLREIKSIAIPQATAASFPFLGDLGSVLGEEWGFIGDDKYGKVI